MASNMRYEETLKERFLSAPGFIFEYGKFFVETNKRRILQVTGQYIKAKYLDI